MTILAWTLFFWSCSVAIVTFVALHRAYRVQPAHPSVRSTLPAGPTMPAGKEAGSPSLLLLRPCAGAQIWLEEALLSSAAVTTCGVPATIVFAVASEADLAWPIAQHVAILLARQGMAVTVAITTPTAPNAKSDQLAACLRLFPEASTIVIADSDVRLKEADLRALLAPLLCPSPNAHQRPVAAVWAPPVEAVTFPSPRPERGARGEGPSAVRDETRTEKTVGDRASRAVLSASLHAFPLLARLDAGGLVGKLLALRRTALDEVGGFGDLKDFLGEDMELAKRLRSRGLPIEVSVRPALSLAQGRPWPVVVARYARWVHVIRSQRPWLLLSYPFLFFPTLVLLSGATLMISSTPRLAVLTALLALSARVAVAWFGPTLAGSVLKTKRSLRDEMAFQISRLIVDPILADSLLFVAFVRALVERQVVWGGRVLTRSTGGRWTVSTTKQSVRRAVRGGLVTLLVGLLSLGPTTASALPRTGEEGRNARLEDADGHTVQLKDFVGKPILIMYEDKESSQQNRRLKENLASLAKGDRYRNHVAIAAVADLSAYNYWPIKGFVRDAIRKESGKVGTTIFCDWDGSFRSLYGFKSGVSSVVLLDRRGRILFAQEGIVNAVASERLVGLLRLQVEG